MLCYLRAIKLNMLPATPFLVDMDGIRLTFGKPFVINKISSWFFNRFCENVEVPINLSEGCYCDLSGQYQMHIL